jgi:hypothetical protein
MGVLARYLDLLTDEAVERVLSATHWTADTYVRNDARCILGHAENWSRSAAGELQCGAPHVFYLRVEAGDELWTSRPLIGERFDRLVRRRGLPRAIRLIRGRLQRRPVFSVTSF